MKGLFQFLDSKFYILRNHRHLRKWYLAFSLAMIPVWFLLGFDSGVGMIEEGLKALFSDGNIIASAYSVYGKTFHFSSFVIYGLLFVGLSRHLEKLSFSGSRNIVYSVVLSLFNVGLFEMWYMTAFAVFQMNRHLIGWFIEDFGRGPPVTHLFFIVLGLFAFVYLWAESFEFQSEEVVGRKYVFKPNITMCIITSLCLASMLLWIFYPLPVERLVIGDWVSSHLFPQTHYAYLQSDVHVANDLLHLVNVTAKALFALTQFYILTRFRRKE